MREDKRIEIEHQSLFFSSWPFLTNSTDQAINHTYLLNFVTSPCEKFVNCSELQITSNVSFSQRVDHVSPAVQRLVREDHVNLITIYAALLLLPHLSSLPSPPSPPPLPHSPSPSPSLPLPFPPLPSPLSSPHGHAQGNTHLRHQVVIKPSLVHGLPRLSCGYTPGGLLLPSPLTGPLIPTRDLARHIRGH